MNTNVPLILALDSATTGCSVCVWRAGRVVAQRTQPMARGQAEVLVPMMRDVMAEAQVDAAALDAVAVTRGPGAFTGLRIALAAARGFAMARGIACVGVTTLEALVHAVPEAQRAGRMVLACVESKREDIYAQVFAADLRPISEPLAANATALAGLFSAGERVLLVGDAATRAQDMLACADLHIEISTTATLPDPAVIAALAAARLDSTTTAPEPLYLRPPDAKLPKAQGRARP